MSRVSDPAVFGKVVVLYGGESAEREVSLQSGAAVLAALQSKGIDATGADTRTVAVAGLADAGYDRAWIALHGRGGEDGTVQGTLQTIGLPYTGSGVLGSALAMDKLRSKMLFRAAGLMTPPWSLPRSEADLETVIEHVGVPCFVKPVAEGSSVGVTRVDEPQQLADAFHAAAADGNDVLVEELIVGPEYTAAMLDGELLPLIRIETPRDFYDYQAKYHSERTLYHCPCGLSRERELELAALSKCAFEIVGASGWGRVDFMLDADGTAHFLEVNTIPGMTSHSLVPMAAATAGMDFETLAWRVLETSLASEVTS
ncbi:MAG: D-alanine--D-alanine ligase [Gammaproteobacteria bacterium]|nr:D-alanine--D-alanine ligase [Gammaproteobacteria bacterium]NNF62479.1 D-alanine--D-alanine ligase [Gammaproteobacteria bacterium]NNM21831.1 D-alanine--D-alanine ligase [Gammaproteobacteria bacterium]